VTPGAVISAGRGPRGVRVWAYRAARGCGTGTGERRVDGGTGGGGGAIHIDDAEGRGGRGTMNEIGLV